MLFSAWQATTQALQPRQVLRSIDMPQAYAPGVQAGYMLPPPLGASTLRSPGETTRTGCRPSIAKWCCVVTSGYRPPVLVASRPAADHTLFPPLSR